MGPPKIPQRADPTPPTLADPALMAARNATLSGFQNAYGRAQTILTSGQGAPDMGAAVKKSLLGG